MAKKHIHKYHKINFFNGKVWACALPDCSHYMPNHLVDMVPGKQSICWHCGESFIMDAHNMVDDRPVCAKCSAGTNVRDALTKFGVI